MKLKSKIFVILLLPCSFLFFGQFALAQVPLWEGPCCYCKPGSVPGAICQIRPVDKTCLEIASNLGCVAEIDFLTSTNCDQYPECPDYVAPSTLTPLKLKLNVAIPGLEELYQEEGVTIDNTTLPKYVAGVYKFFVGIAGIIAVFMIIFGGAQWLFASGSAEKIAGAKETIVGAVVGLILALGSYAILYAINPRLVILPDFLIPKVKYRDTVYRLDGTQCDPLPSGLCSVASLANTCFGTMGSQALIQAAGICRIESGGQSVPSGVDKCQPGGEAVSFGLFQINISANGINNLNCPSAFDGGPYTAQDHQCTIANSSLYQQCQAAALDPSINIQKACELYRGSGASWRLWGANKVCRF